MGPHLAGRDSLTHRIGFHDLFVAGMGKLPIADQNAEGPSAGRKRTPQVRRRTNRA
jgi:hypothetical protein